MRRKPMGWGVRLLIATVAAMLAAFALITREAKAPVEEDYAARQETLPPVSSVSETGERIAPGCEIIQTMGFSRCGHSVTRRLAVPGELSGADFQAVQAHYSLWRIEEFAADQIEMTREIPLYCPAHRVLSVSESGQIVLTFNAYGDGMAVEKTYEDLSIGDFSPEEQEKLLPGLGFDTREDAEAWLRAH